MYEHDDDFFEMSLDCICVAGRDGYFKRLNQSWVRTLGWSKDELLARPILDFVLPEDHHTVLNARAAMFEKGSHDLLRNRYRTKDGGFRWFEWRSVYDFGKELVYAVARDVTEQMEAELALEASRVEQEKMKTQLIFADRMSSVGTLAAGVAHEINNPLTFIVGNLSLVQELYPGDAKLQKMIGESLKGAERIRKIVLSLNTLSRSENEAAHVVDLLPIVQTSIDMTQNEIRHAAHLETHFERVPNISGDSARLGQVLINLLINAAQAMEGQAYDDSVIKVSTYTNDAGEAVVEVKDTGPGISEENKQKIFEPFFTTKPVGVGTGLGLSICHSIIAGFGGRIELNSSTSGSAFRVILPASDQEITLQSPTVVKASEKSARILVVDDEPVIGMVISQALREHDVVTKTSALEALETLESAEFDLILTDLMMPGLTGMDFFERLERSGDSRADSVIFMTGGAFTSRAQAFLEAHPRRCIEKPFTPDELRLFIQRWIGLRTKH